MRKSHLHLVVIVIAVLGFGSIAEAKTRDKAWEFGGMIQHIDADSGAFIDNSYGGQLRFGYDFSSKVEMEVVYGFTDTQHLGIDDSFRRTLLLITGNLLTDRDMNTVPYISAGLGIIQETRAPFNGPMGHVLESFDASAILTIAFGARTFFTDNLGVRYEAAYNRQNSFDLGQNEYVLSAGITWLVGGKK